MSRCASTQARTTSASAPRRAEPADGLLERTCACGAKPRLTGACEACRRKPVVLQRAPAAGGERSEVPTVVHEVLREPGQPLDADDRAALEAQLGHDFGRVRVHADARATASARSIGALAYTVGRDVVVDAAHYAPGTARGRRLLAHELTHVVQQRGASAAGQPLAIDTATAGPREREAERVARLVDRGDRGIRGDRGRVAVSHPVSRPLLQRQTKVEEPAAGCGMCHGSAMLAGSLAHKLIQIEEFVPVDMLRNLAELPVECVQALRRPPRPDLVMLRGSTWLIGSIKPARARYYAKSKEVFDYYRSCIRRAARMKGQPTPTVLPLRVPIPLSGMPFPNWQVRRCPPQRFMLNAPDAHGTYGYYCTPPRSRLVHRPECRCPPRRRRGRRSRRARQREARRSARAARRSVERGLRAQGVKRASRLAVARAAGAVAGRIALRAVPVVGWVLLAIDVAQAAYGIYSLVAHGRGSGGDGGERAGARPEGGERAGERPKADERPGEERAADEQPGDERAADERPGDGGGPGQEPGGAGGEGGSAAEGAGPGLAEGHLDDEELRQLGIFASAEEAEAYAESLPLSRELLDALKRATPAQQELLRLLLAASGESGAAAVDEAFFVKLLAMGESVTLAEVEALRARMVPVRGERQDDLLERLERALRTVRAAGRGAAGRRARTSRRDAPRREPRPGTPAAGGAGAGDRRGSGSGTRSRGDAGDARTAPASPRSAAAGATDRAVRPPPGVDRTPSGDFAYVILSGLEASGSYVPGRAYPCTVRIVPLDGSRSPFTLSGVRITYLGRSDREESGGTIVTTFALHFTEDVWSRRNAFLVLGGPDTSGDYQFPPRRR
jgi:hypothetical protein